MSYNQNLKNLEAIYRDKHFDLVVRCKNGERQAHQELYKLYAKAMYNVAMRILNRNDEADDVLQEAFLEAFTKIKDFRQETTFGLWLKQIVIHRSINLLRKRKMEFEDIDEVDVESLVDDGPYDDEELILKVEEVRKAIQLLPEGYRLVLSLYLIEGYDHEEIGQILKINEGTSRTQFLRAKRKLIEILKQKGVEA
ncbi:RNA polymerase sigma factor [Pelobium sp.]|nr:RNA polymerase sigma factor [Pelobium sp.]MDA9555631.1 RNA polymerase sigma factor [Pelobium sp.]